MRVVHESADGDERVLARTVEVADSVAKQTRGLMFRDVPEDFALVFEFGSVWFRSVHMLFVREPLDVVWLRDDEVVQVKTVSPWTGFGIARADRFIELPGGAAEGVEPGDRVVVESVE